MRLSISLPILLIVGLGVTGCKGSGAVPQTGRQLSTSADALAFGEEFGNAVYIGTQPVNDLTATNVGTEAITISSVSKTGDGAFTVQGPNDVNQQPLTTIAPNKSVYFQVVFAPTEGKQYNGAFVIHSNAQNAADKQIILAGCGVSPDAGTVSYCVFDGGA